MDYKKPQSTLVQGGVGIYPLTTADQVILSDGSRLEKDGKIIADSAADSAKLGGKVPEYYIQPRNLLDNSDFTNPVNQRGQTSYSGIWVYSIDRWAAWLDASSPATVSVVSGGITPFPGMIIQRLESKYIDSNKTYTLAAMTGDGLLVLSGKITSTTQSSTNVNNGIHFDFNEDSDTYQFTLSGTTSASKFVWAALYEGSYTAETLPPYVPKGYAAELAECNRYFRLLKIGGAVNESYIGYRMPLSPVMRTNPSTTGFNITTTSGQATITAGGYTAESDCFRVDAYIGSDADKWWACDVALSADL